MRKERTIPTRQRSRERHARRLAGRTRTVRVTGRGRRILRATWERASLRPPASRAPCGQPALPPALARGRSGMRIGVFGATGVIGSALVPVLAADHDVVAVSRHADRVRHPGVETATADVTDSAAVRSALEGGHDVTSSRRRRSWQRGVRDDRRARRPAPRDDRSSLGVEADAADRPGDVVRYLAGGSGAGRGDERELRRPWPRRHDVPRDDRAHRGGSVSSEG